MRVLRIIAMCVIAVNCALAQNSASSSPPHGITVLELKWARKDAPPLPPAMTEAPYDIVGGRREVPAGGEIDALRRPTAVSSSPPAKENRYVFIYSLKVQNVGAKTVQGILWEYIITDLATGEELGRRRIINYQKIKQGSVETLRTEYPSPPTNVVTAKGLGDNEKSPFRERAEIICVLYTDQTTWQLPNAEGTPCEELRQVDVDVRTKKKGR